MRLGRSDSSSSGNSQGPAGASTAMACSIRSMPSPLVALSMKVSAKGSSAFSAAVSGSSCWRSMRSILFSASQIGRLVPFSLSTTARTASVKPALASTTRSAMSASCAPPHAAATIARSSRRFGAKMPGVSTRISCAGGRITTARMRNRVVCGLGETMLTLVPDAALTRVDLPALGAPMMAIRAQRVSVISVRSTPGSRETGSLG